MCKQARSEPLRGEKMSHDLMASPCVMPYRTFIDFLLDESGSMKSCLNQTVAGFNNFIKDQASQNGECYITLTKFTTTTKTPYENLDIALAPELTFSPSGGTKLFDAVIDRLERIIPSLRKDTISLFVIMTDGEDIGSTRSITEARGIISRAQSAGMVVVYLGPSSTALAVGENLGIPQGNIKPFDTSDMANTMTTLNQATTAFRSGSTSGQTFFA